MIVSSLKDDASGVIEAPALRGEKLLPSAVIYGANASGKSNLLMALSFMRAAILFSHSRGGPQSQVPRRPFALSPEGENTPTRMSIEFVHKGIRYKYGFEAFTDRFDSEWLYWWPSGVRAELFKRNGQSIHFGRGLKGQNRIIEELTRPNSLFLSAAMQNNHDQLTNIGEFFSSIIISRDSISDGKPAVKYFEDSTIGEKILHFLNDVGSGIDKFEIFDDNSQLSDVSERNIRKNIAGQPNVASSDIDDYIRRTRRNIRFGHRGLDGSVSYFNYSDESIGTRWLATRLGPLFQALNEGAVIAIDEFGGYVHTLAVDAILSLFASKDTNPKGAQLIAATHDTNLLKSQYIRRDQIWFTEKDELGATALVPLTDIRTRKGDDIEKGYLQGRYGAIPFSGLVPAPWKVD